MATEFSRKQTFHKNAEFLTQTKVKGRLPKILLPVKPVICIAGIGVGIIAAEVVAGFGILQNTRNTENQLKNRHAGQSETQME